MSAKNKINLEEFKKEVFKNIAPMGNAITRAKFIDVIDELKEARAEFITLKRCDGTLRSKLETTRGVNSELRSKISTLERRLKELGIKDEYLGG